MQNQKLKNSASLWFHRGAFNNWRWCWLWLSRLLLLGMSTPATEPPPGCCCGPPNEHLWALQTSQQELQPLWKPGPLRSSLLTLSPRDSHPVSAWYPLLFGASLWLRLCLQCRRPEFDPRVGKIPGEGDGDPSPPGSQYWGEAGVSPWLKHPELCCWANPILSLWSGTCGPLEWEKGVFEFSLKCFS